MSQLQEKLVGYASRPEAEMALFAASMGEVLFLPIAADSLLVPMVVINNDRAFRYAMIATAGAVAGGVLVFLLGFLFYQVVGASLVQSYGLNGEYAFLREIFASYNVLIVVAAGLATIPFKTVSLLSGFFLAGLPSFTLASVVSRAARSFLMAWLLWRGGSRYKEWIDRYFQGLTAVLALGTLIFFVMILLLVKTA